jgi:hypothetical protein
MYLNWMFHNDNFMFMHAPEAMFNGVWQTSDQYSWLNQWGGEWLATLAWTTWLSLLSFPATVWMTWRFRQHERVIHTAPKLFLIPAVAACLGSVGFALFHAVDILFLQVGVFMTALLLLPRLMGNARNILMALLLLGNIGGWYVMFYSNHSEDLPPAQIQNWAMAFTHNVPGSASDENLARFLNKEPFSTLIDERSGARVIAAKDNVENLVLPFRIEVKVMDKYFLDTIDQFATINPSHPRFVVDGVAKRFEGIYWGGIQGHHLVYDDQQWRVYRRDGVTVPSTVKSDKL